MKHRRTTYYESRAGHILRLRYSFNTGHALVCAPERAPDPKPPCSEERVEFAMPRMMTLAGHLLARPVDVLPI